MRIELSDPDIKAISPRKLPKSPKRSKPSSRALYHVSEIPTSPTYSFASTACNSERSVFVRDGSCETRISTDNLNPRHISQLEALNVNDQCTFQPEVHPLPKMYQRHQPRRSIPFLERQEKWRRRVQLDRKFLEEELLESELEECTFTPKR
eukprot:UN04799